MEKRAYAVDLLRGLAIVGMVLSGQILWHAELPAWLFHAQVPPPSFRTFVDLVPLLSDADGELRIDLTKDGIHLHPVGYVIWTDYLKKQKYLK